MKIIIIVLLALLVPLFPILTFADDLQVPTILQVPSTMNDSELGYIVISTNIINDDVSIKQASDFTINVEGSTAFPSSFKADLSPKFKIIPIKEGEYSVSVKNSQGYKTSFKGQCEGIIKAGEIKSCLITLNNIKTRITITSNSKSTNIIGITKQYHK